MRKIRVTAAAAAAAATVGAAGWLGLGSGATADPVVSAGADQSAPALVCPAGSPAMHTIADYDANRSVTGFDSPQAALDHLLATAYPGMPPGLLKASRTTSDAAVFTADVASAVVVEVDRIVRGVPNEDGETWVMHTFSICESAARRWAAR